MWMCQGPGLKDIWETALVNLEGWFNNLQTDPDIQHYILLYLRGWTADR
jgi:hypothetical protein